MVDIRNAADRIGVWLGGRSPDTEAWEQLEHAESDPAAREAICGEPMGAAAFREALAFVRGRHQAVTTLATAAAHKAQEPRLPERVASLIRGGEKMFPLAYALFDHAEAASTADLLIGQQTLWRQGFIPDEVICAPEAQRAALEALEAQRAAFSAMLEQHGSVLERLDAEFERRSGVWASKHDLDAARHFVDRDLPAFMAVYFGTARPQDGSDEATQLARKAKELGVSFDTLCALTTFHMTSILVAPDLPDEEKAILAEITHRGTEANQAILNIRQAFKVAQTRLDAHLGDVVGRDATLQRWRHAPQRISQETGIDQRMPPIARATLNPAWMMNPQQATHLVSFVNDALFYLAPEQAAPHLDKALRPEYLREYAEPVLLFDLHPGAGFYELRAEREGMPLEEVDVTTCDVLAHHFHETLCKLLEWQRDTLLDPSTDDDTATAVLETAYRTNNMRRFGDAHLRAIRHLCFDDDGLLQALPGSERDDVNALRQALFEAQDAVRTGDHEALLSLFDRVVNDPLLDYKQRIACAQAFAFECVYTMATKRMADEGEAMETWTKEKIHQRFRDACSDAARLFIGKSYYAFSAGNRIDEGAATVLGLRVYHEMIAKQDGEAN